MLITLWELIGIRHSSPPSSLIRWVCEDFWKQTPPGRCLSVRPPSSACPALVGLEILKSPSFPSPWCPRTCCNFSHFSFLCHSPPKFFSRCWGKQVWMGWGNGGRWHCVEGGKNIPLRAGHPQWITGQPGPFSCSLTCPSWPNLSLWLWRQTGEPQSAPTTPLLLKSPQFSKANGLQFLPFSILGSA